MTLHQLCSLKANYNSQGRTKNVGVPNDAHSDVSSYLPNASAALDRL